MPKKFNALMNIVVLGSKGFIGSSLLRHLSGNCWFNVLGLDVPELDLTDERQVCSAMPELVKDSIVIVAAAITRDRDNSIAAMIDNIKMVANLSHVLGDYPAGQVIYLSTVDVYGRRNLTLPLNELSNIQPSNYYGISKITREYILRLACGAAGSPLAILRLPGVYGPNDTHKSPINVFATRAIEGRPIEVRGNGAELRDFLYIEDLCRIAEQVILRGIWGTFNIVTGQSHPIGYILKVIETFCGRPVEVSFKGRQEDSDLVFEPSAILREIPEFQFIDVEIGLEQTVKYYQEQLSCV